MDVIDILGGLVGNKSKGGGAGSKILRDILMGGKKSAPPTPSDPMPKAAPTKSPYSPSSRGTSPDDIAAQARELEDILITAGDRQARRTPSAAPTPTPTPQPRQQAPTRVPQSAPKQTPQGHFPPATDPQQEQAKVLVRAMVSAAKADGQISQEEQQSILQQIGDTSPEAIAFLRAEFSKPADVRELAWSVPLGMEQQVYTISLVAIDRYTDREASYLRELAHGLRLAPDVCNQIHQRFGIPGLS